MDSSEAERETGRDGEEEEREEERETKQKRRGAGCFRQWKYMCGNIATTGTGENWNWSFESIASIYLCLVFLWSKLASCIQLLLCVVLLFIGLLPPHFINHLSLPSFTFKRNSFHQ